MKSFVCPIYFKNHRHVIVCKDVINAKDILRCPYCDFECAGPGDFDEALTAFIAQEIEREL